MESNLKKEENQSAYNDYLDIVKEQKRQFDTFFALKLWRPNPVLQPEATRAISDKILASPHMTDVINQVQLLSHSLYSINCCDLIMKYIIL